MNTKRAVIYARVSLDLTGEHRSVERQVEACRQLAQMRGWEVVDIKTDNSISAYADKERPAWNATMELIESGDVDVLISWHIDRMTRSMLALEELILLAQKHEVSIATVSGDIDLSTDMGRMVARILAAVARAEVERKAARQRLANQQRAAEGRPHVSGFRAFGYEQDGLTVVPEEAEAIREAAEDVLMGTSLRQVARDWNARGLKSAQAVRRHAKKVTRAELEGTEVTPTGWSPTGVRRILLNPRYAGIRVYRGEEVAEGAWDKILDLEKHLELTDFLTSKGRNFGTVKMGGKATTLLTGVATCGKCGGTTIGTSDPRNGRLKYSCKSGSCFFVPREDVDAWVSGLFLGIYATAKKAEGVGLGSAELTKLEEERERVVTDIDRAIDLMLDGKQGPQMVERITKRAEKRLAEIDAQIEAAKSAVATEKRVDLDHLGDRWDDMTLERQRELVGHYLDVKIHPTNGRRKVHPREYVVVEPRPRNTL